MQDSRRKCFLYFVVVHLSPGNMVNTNNMFDSCLLLLLLIILHIVYDIINKFQCIYRHFLINNFGFVLGRNLMFNVKSGYKKQLRTTRMFWKRIK